VDGAGRRASGFAPERLGQAAAAARPDRFAVFVTHGMGEQIRFQTLDLVAEGLRGQDAIARGVSTSALPPPGVRSIVLGGERLQRAELFLRRPDGSEREVHVYEGYWAPLTEGQVRLRDVIAFLLRGAVNGIWNGIRRGGLARWLFGRYSSFPVPRSTLPALVISLAALAGLIALNGAVTFVGLVAIARSLLDRPPMWLDGSVFTRLLSAMEAFLALVALFLASLFASWALRRRTSARFLRRAAGALSIFFLALVVAGLAFGGVWLPIVFWIRLAMGAPVAGDSTPPTARLQIIGAICWPVLFALSVWVRSILVQYPGDLAAYVSSYTLDRFNDLRSRIKDTIWKKARAIYAASSEGGVGFEYAECAVVGHSLGSVIAYDTLNRLILDDAPPRAGEIDTGGLDVVSRTRLFLTFGSPLDKTAFIFGVQGMRTTEAREALAASLQPMLCDYALRPRKWINVYSPWDIVSGFLDYYDPPGSTDSRKIDNRIDPQATTLLKAHLEYWRNPLLFQILHRELTS
jgi:hypothetical protein